MPITVILLVISKYMSKHKFFIELSLHLVFEVEGFDQNLVE